MMNVKTVFSELDIGCEFIICETNRVIFVKTGDKSAVQQSTKHTLAFAPHQVVFREFAR